MFYAIFTCAERVDWSCYEAFRRAIWFRAEQTRAAQLAPALKDAGSPGHPDTQALNHEGDSSHLYQVPLHIEFSGALIARTSSAASANQRCSVLRPSVRICSRHKRHCDLKVAVVHHVETVGRIRFPAHYVHTNHRLLPLSIVLFSECVQSEPSLGHRGRRQGGTDLARAITLSTRSAVVIGNAITLLLTCMISSSNHFAGRPARRGGPTASGATGPADLVTDPQLPGRVFAWVYLGADERH